MAKTDLNVRIDEFEEEHIIDTAKDFYCSCQDKEYNDSYYKWRATPDNPYSFQYVNNTKEHVYIDGKGFVEQNPKKIERESLAKYAFLLGGVLSLYFAIEIFGEGLMCLIYRLFGGDVSWSVVSGMSGGSEFLTTLNNIIVGTLKRILPIAIFMRVTKFPIVNAIPVKVVQQKPHRLAIPFAMVMVAVVSFLNQMYMNVLEYLQISESSAQFYFPSSAAGQSAMILADLLIVPVISELCQRGIIMQSLRQYGDGFALLFTSLIAAFMAHDITQSCSIFIMALCIGYFVMETGSIKTGIIMRITYRTCVYAQFLFPYFIPAGNINFVNCCYLLALVIVGAVWLVIAVKDKRNFIRLKMNKTYLSAKEKILCVITSNAMILWLLLTYVLTLSKLRFRN